MEPFWRVWLQVGPRHQGQQVHAAVPVRSATRSHRLVHHSTQGQNTQEVRHFAEEDDHTGATLLQ